MLWDAPVGLYGRRRVWAVGQKMHLRLSILSTVTGHRSPNITCIVLIFNSVSNILLQY